MIIFTPYYIYAQNLSSLFYLTNYTVPVLRLVSCDLRLKFFSQKIPFFLCRYKKKQYLCTAFRKGKLPEWSIGPHSKCGERVTVPGVRIPHFPRKKRAISMLGLLFFLCSNRWIVTQN